MGGFVPSLLWIGGFCPSLVFLAYDLFLGEAKGATFAWVFSC
jgi:hypothetical protein